MPEDTSSPNEPVKKSDRIAPSTSPAALPAKRDPIWTAKIILVLFVIAGGALLISDLGAIIVGSEEHVFVAVDEQRFHVWQDVGSYEADTGKFWINQPLGTTDYRATYHKSQLESMISAWPHLLFLVFSLIALRACQQARRAERRHPVVSAAAIGRDQEPEIFPGV